MRIQVNGKQMDVGTALSAHAEGKITEVVHKYAERPVEAVVTFSKDRHEFLAESSVHLSTGLTATAKGRAGDVYDSFDRSLERMEKQLRRYKRRLKDHHKDRTSPVDVMDAPSYILAGAGESDETEPQSLQPVIVAEMATQVKSLSVGEAVMQMELTEANVLVFKNEKHGGVNVVYRRDDGNFGWVDPQNID